MIADQIKFLLNLILIVYFIRYILESVYCIDLKNGFLLMFEKNLLCNLYYLSLIMRMYFIRIQPKLIFCFLLQLIRSGADVLLDVRMIHITVLCMICLNGST